MPADYILTIRKSTVGPLFLTTQIQEGNAVVINGLNVNNNLYGSMEVNAPQQIFAFFSVEDNQRPIVLPQSAQNIPLLPAHRLVFIERYDFNGTVIPVINVTALNGRRFTTLIYRGDEVLEGIETYNVVVPTQPAVNPFVLVFDTAANRYDSIYAEFIQLTSRP